MRLIHDVVRGAVRREVECRIDGDGRCGIVRDGPYLALSGSVDNPDLCPNPHIRGPVGTQTTGRCIRDDRGGRRDDLAAISIDPDCRDCPPFLAIYTVEGAVQPEEFETTVCGGISNAVIYRGGLRS